MKQNQITNPAELLQTAIENYERAIEDPDFVVNPYVWLTLPTSESGKYQGGFAGAYLRYTIGVERCRAAADAAYHKSIAPLLGREHVFPTGFVITERSRKTSNELYALDFFSRGKVLGALNLLQCAQAGWFSKQWWDADNSESSDPEAFMVKMKVHAASLKATLDEITAGA